MNEWKLEIRKVDNGYILRGRTREDAPPIAIDDIEIVVETLDTEFSELESMQKLLYEVKEYFAVYYSKHDKKNVIIEIEETNMEELK